MSHSFGPLVLHVRWIVTPETNRAEQRLSSGLTSLAVLSPCFKQPLGIPADEGEPMAGACLRDLLSRLIIKSRRQILEMSGIPAILGEPAMGKCRLQHSRWGEQRDHNYRNKSS